MQKKYIVDICKNITVNKGHVNIIYRCISPREEHPQRKHSKQCSISYSCETFGNLKLIRNKTYR